MTQRERNQRKNKAAMYSEEFQEMLDRIEEEDYVDRSEIMGTKKSRICLEKVKALEQHFEEENKLQPERKIRIAEEVGLEPRQVAIWFQNRRARWKSKHLEKEYNQLRASYDALMLDYDSLQHEKLALLNQLKELKAKSEGTSIEANNNNYNYTPSISTSIHSNNIPFKGGSSSSSSSTRFESVSVMSNEYQQCKAYQEQLMMMEELGMLNCSDASASCNFFSSVDQPPTLPWQYATNDFN